MLSTALSDLLCVYTMESIKNNELHIGHHLSCAPLSSKPSLGKGVREAIHAGCKTGFASLRRCLVLATFLKRLVVSELSVEAGLGHHGARQVHQSPRKDQISNYLVV